MKYTPGWSSHIPILVKILEKTQGDVLELGVGLFSTPLLHWLCQDQQRNLVSFESQQKYFDLNRQFQSDSHHLSLIADWDQIDIDRHWSVAFIDHEPAERRVVEIKRLAKSADYLIIHDSQSKEDSFYHYSQIYPLFKYRYDYTQAFPNTSVLSNFNRLEWLGGKK